MVKGVPYVLKHLNNLEEMTMLSAIILISIFLLVTSIIMPWVNYSETKELNKKLLLLATKLQKLDATISIDRARSNNTEAQTFVQEPIVKPLEVKTDIPPQQSVPTIPHPDSSQKSSDASFMSRFINNFEQQFGAKLPVWIGGIALAIGGFFLVRYSIENSLIGPEARTAVGILLGGALLFAADKIRRTIGFADNIRIAQSLSGAGIVILYFSVYAATNLYEFIPSYMGFVGMSVITALTLVLSLKHGAPIALIGLVGGFLTPVLIGSNDPSIPVLLTYLYFVFTGMMITIRQNNWWWLSILALIATFSWVVALIFLSTSPNNIIWFSIFLLAISGTIVVSSKKYYEDKDAPSVKRLLNPTSVLNYLGLGVSIIIIALLTVKLDLGLMEWGIFALIAAGSLGLAYFNTRIYSFACWLSLAVNIMMLLFWETADVNMLALTIGSFATIYIGLSYFFVWRKSSPLFWASFTCASSLSYYLIAYRKLGGTELFDDIPLFYGFTAILFAGLAIYAVEKTREMYDDSPDKNYLLALFALTATAFISIGCTIELEREFLSIAFAAEIFAIAWIHSKLKIKALPYISMVLAIIFGWLLLPQIFLLLQLAIYSLFEINMRGGVSVLPIMERPLFQLGLPALMFIGASYFFRHEQDDRAVKIFDVASVGLITIMLYYLTRHAFYPDSEFLFIKASFLERSISTNVMFISGLVCFFVGRTFTRVAFSWSGIALCGISFFRVAYFDLLLYNPLWSMQKIHGWVIFNSMFLSYIVPLLWMWLANQELIKINIKKWQKYIYGFMVLPAFTWLNLNIRYFFHKDHWDQASRVQSSNIEIYTYSIAWLLLGIGLLLLGTLKQNKTLRYASLVVILLAVGKVFLYDASQLQDLYRIFSFFGLGISLIGLSWFYTRFVFGDNENGSKAH